MFKVESPARRLMQHLLSRCIFYGVTVPGTLGESPTKQAFNSQYISKTSVPNNDGFVDAIRHFLFTDNFTKPYSHEHILVHLLHSNILHIFFFYLIHTIYTELYLLYHYYTMYCCYLFY